MPLGFLRSMIYTSENDMREDLAFPTGAKKLFVTTAISAIVAVALWYASPVGAVRYDSGAAFSPELNATNTTTTDIN